MPRSTLFTLLALIFAPTLMIGAGTPVAKTDTTRTDVQAFVKAYVEATNKADVTAMMEMFSRKPGVTFVSDGEIARGWDAIRTDSDQIVGKEGSYKISIGSIDVTPLGSSYALAVAPYTVTVVTEKGNVQLPSAMSLVLEKSGTAWTIVHEHSSSKAQDQEEQGTE